MALKLHGRIVAGLPKVQNLLGQLTRQRQLCSVQVTHTFTSQQVDKLSWSIEPFAELARAAMGFGHGWCGISLRCDEGDAKSNLQIQLRLQAFGSVRHVGDKAQAFSQLRLRLYHRLTHQRLLASL